MLVGLVIINPNAATNINDVNQSLILAHEIKYGSGKPYVYT
jgi:hypothetical protein